MKEEDPKSIVLIENKLFEQSVERVRCKIWYNFVFVVSNQHGQKDGMVVFCKDSVNLFVKNYTSHNVYMEAWLK